METKKISVKTHERFDSGNNIIMNFTYNNEKTTKLIITVKTLKIVAQRINNMVFTFLFTDFILFRIFKIKKDSAKQ
jgi:hypothetical protein